MQRQGHQPSALIYSSLIATCNKHNQLDLSKRLFEEMKQKQLQPNWSSVIIKTKEQISEETVSKPDENVVTLSSRIEEIEKNQQGREALSIWTEMKQSGIQTDASSYRSLIRTLSKSQEWAASLQLLQEVWKQGLQLDEQTSDAASSAYGVAIAGVPDLLKTCLLPFFKHCMFYRFSFKVMQSMSARQAFHSHGTWLQFVMSTGRPAET